MPRNAKKQPSSDRDSLPIRVGTSYLAVIARLAREARKTQRVIIEENLDLAFKMRRVAVDPPSVEGVDQSTKSKSTQAA